MLQDIARRLEALEEQKQYVRNGREEEVRVMSFWNKLKIDTAKLSVSTEEKNKVSGITVILGGSKQLPGVVQQKSGSENVFSLLHQEK